MLPISRAAEGRRGIVRCAIIADVADNRRDVIADQRRVRLRWRLGIKGNGENAGGRATIACGIRGGGRQDV